MWPKSCCSQSYFGRAFKASSGVSPHRWLLDHRIARVQELLLDGELPLVQIALETGFSEQSHFLPRIPKRGRDDARRLAAREAVLTSRARGARLTLGLSNSFNTFSWFAVIGPL